jgi:predicted TIM-barrel fold metal-dependent hydrolase
MFVVDCHCHAGTGEVMTAPWTTRAPLTNYLRRARAAGIHKTVIFSLFRRDYAKGNAEVARLVARAPRRLIGFAFVHPKRDAGRIFHMVERAVTQWNFRGIKVHAFESMPTREVCQTARAFNLPLLVDVAGKTQAIDLFAPEYPDVNFIIPHLGSFMDDWGAHARVIDQMIRYPNVYADTSAVRRFDYVVEAVRRAGPRKLLFGSDGPWLHPGLELQKIRLLGLPPSEQALITGGNLLRLIRNAGQSRPNTSASARLRASAGRNERSARSLDSSDLASLESEFESLHESAQDPVPF